MTSILFVLAASLQDPEPPDLLKPFRARVRIEIASKVRDNVHVLEGTLIVRPGESLVAELKDENKRRTRIDVRGDAPTPDRFFALDLWRRTAAELRERYEWRPEDAPAEPALPEAVGGADGRPRPPVPAKLGPGARVAAAAEDRPEGGRSFLLVPRLAKQRGRTLRVTFEGPRLARAVADGPDAILTIVLSGFREVAPTDDAAPDVDSGNSNSEERR